MTFTLVRGGDAPLPDGPETKAQAFHLSALCYFFSLSNLDFLNLPRGKDEGERAVRVFLLAHTERSTSY